VIRRLKCLVLIGALAAVSAPAQEPAFMDAATHPAQGQAYLRLLGHASEWRADGRDSRRVSLLGKASFGLRSATALMLEPEWNRVKEEGADAASGWSRLGILLKQRFWRKDLGPLDTWRASWLAGADLPGEKAVRASAHAAPRLGVVTTAILGRHGLNGQVDWTGYRDGDDRLRVNASYLFRLAPAVYRADTRGAWYMVTESLNEFTAGSHARFDAALGLLYEAWGWAAEVGVRLPLASDGGGEDLRQEVVVGLRWLP